VVTGTPAVVYGNVPNATGLISNLPPEACVEVPCLVDHNGVQPTAVGCAAAPARSAQPHQHRSADPDCAGCAHWRLGQRPPAVAVDPLTAAMCTLERLAR
jgi:alpha-galactosidase